MKSLYTLVFFLWLNLSNAIGQEYRPLSCDACGTPNNAETEVKEGDPCYCDAFDEDTGNSTAGFTLMQWHEVAAHCWDGCFVFQNCANDANHPNRPPIIAVDLCIQSDCFEGDGYTAYYRDQSTNSLVPVAAGSTYPQPITYSIPINPPLLAGTSAIVCFELCALRPECPFGILICANIIYGSPCANKYQRPHSKIQTLMAIDSDNFHSAASLYFPQPANTSFSWNLTNNILQGHNLVYEIINSLGQVELRGFVDNNRVDCNRLTQGVHYLRLLDSITNTLRHAGTFLVN